MDLYTLTKTFMPKDIVGEFASAIWTERYWSAGDVQLVTPATPTMIKKLARGTFLGLRGTKEIMILETQTIEDGLLTVYGQSLPKFLDEREGRYPNPDFDTDKPVTDYTDTVPAGVLISSAVDKMAINPVAFPAGYPTLVNLDWAKEKIPGLSLGLIDMNGDVVDANGTPKRLTIRVGPLYTAIQQLAEKEGVGIKLYLQSSKFSTGYVLKFATYRGKDRTSQQTGNQLVRLTPKTDSLTSVKEVSSIASYKNVVYVSYKNELSTHYAEPSLPIPEGFDRRVLLVDAEDIFLFGQNIPAYREQTARDAFANNNYVLAVDGQISPHIDYEFNVDYGLGDIVELEGLTGALSKARITEYIRSQDKFGEREYPTLSVIDPLNTDFMPDLEPDPDHDTPFDGDPDYDFDFDTTDLDPIEDDFGPDTDPDTDPNPDPKPYFPNDEPPDPPSDPNQITRADVEVPLGKHYKYQIDRLQPIASDGPPYLEYAGFEVSVHGSETWLEAYISKDPPGVLGSHVTYDPVAHRVMDIHAGAVSGNNQTLEFRTSPDGVNWTTLWSYDAPVGNFYAPYKTTLSDYFKVYKLLYIGTPVLPEHPESEFLTTDPDISGQTAADVPFVFDPGTLVYNPINEHSPTDEFQNGPDGGWWNYESAVGMDPLFYPQSWRANSADFNSVTELYIGIFQNSPTDPQPARDALLALVIGDFIRLRIPHSVTAFADAPFGTDITYKVTGPTALQEVKLGHAFNEGDYGPWVTVPVTPEAIFSDGAPIGTYTATSIHMPKHT